MSDAVAKKARPRIGWIDTLRGFAIIFVVLGHATRGSGSEFERYVYSIHLPLFFFLSGLLQREALLAGPFSLYAGKFFRSLLVPYFTFGFLTYFLWMSKQLSLLGPHPATAEYLLMPLAGMAYGVHGAHGFLAHNGALWFLPCLFTMHLLFFLIRRQSAGWLGLAGWTVLSSSLGFLLARITPLSAPWGLDLAMMNLPFFAIGYLLQGRLLRGGRHDFFSWTLLLLLPIHFLLQRANSQVDLNLVAYGDVHLFFLAAITGILGWIPIAQVTSRLTILAFLGRNSIIVFTLNSLLMFLISVVFLRLGFDEILGRDSLFGEIARGVAVLAVALPTIYMVNRWAPWMLPGRTNRKIDPPGVRDHQPPPLVESFPSCYQMPLTTRPPLAKANKRRR